MGATAAATLAALTGREPVLRASAGHRRRRRPPPTPSSCCGWPAAWPQTETFDPKRYTPFAPGVPANEVLSTFPAIDTAVDHIKFTAGLEQIGRVIDRGTRASAASPPPTSASSCTRGISTTGTPATSRRSRWPCRTSARSISRTLGPRNPDMPAFVAIGQTVEGAGEIGTLKAFHTAGFLGAEHGPFLIVDPQDAASAVRPPKELTDARFRSRRQLLSGAARAEPGASPRRRVPARVAGALARRRRSPARLAGGEGVRRLARAGGEPRRLRPDALRPRLPAGAAPDRRRRPLRRGHLRVHPVRALGHARARPRARQGR